MGNTLALRGKATAANAGTLRKSFRIAQIWTLLSLACAPIVACGGSDEPEPKTPEEQIRTFVDLYTDMVCDLVDRCCNDISKALLGIGGDDTCQTVVGVPAGASGFVTEMAIDRGTVRYHEDVQRRCAAALAAASCEELESETPVPECEELWFEPLVPLEGVCHNDVECIDGYCLPPASARRARKDFLGPFLSPAPDVPPSQCVELLPDGADCTENDHCESGSCEDEVCEARQSTLDALCPL